MGIWLRIQTLIHFERHLQPKNDITSPNTQLAKGLSVASDICTSGSLLSGVFPITSAGNYSFSAPLFTQSTNISDFSRSLSTANMLDTSM